MVLLTFRIQSNNCPVTKLGSNFIFIIVFLASLLSGVSWP